MPVCLYWIMLLRQIRSFSFWGDITSDRDIPTVLGVFSHPASLVTLDGWGEGGVC